MPSTANTGALGEKIAAKYLLKHGYQILAKNYRLGHKEIDIVSRLGDLIVLVEVKTARQGSLVKPEEQLSTLKIKKLKQATSLYCQTNKIGIDLVHCDLLAISLDFASKMAKIKHFKNLF